VVPLIVILVESIRCVCLRLINWGFLSVSERRRSREASPSVLSRSGSIQEEEIPLGTIRNPGGRHLTPSSKFRADGAVGASQKLSTSSSRTTTTTGAGPSRLRLSLGLEGNSPLPPPDSGQLNSTQVLSSPPENPPLSTPQNETSFISTLGSTPPTLSNSGRRKKGVIETV